LNVNHFAGTTRFLDYLEEGVDLVGGRRAVRRAGLRPEASLIVIVPDDESLAMA
jgi:hypothetical protein